MATPLKPRTYVPRLRDNRIDGVKYNRSSSKRNNFEMFAWLGMRLSGVVLVVLIFGHLFSNLMVGDGIHAIDFGFVGGKWANPFWRGLGFAAALAGYAARVLTASASSSMTTLRRTACAFG